MHAFISSRVDYCNAVFNGAPQYVMGTLQRVLNAAARLINDARKYNRGLSTLIHDQLHRLNVPERVEYKLAVMDSWSVGVWRTKHQGIWSTNALRSPTSPVDIDDQPTCTAWLFRGINAARSVGRPSQSRSNCLEYTACRTAWTGCEQRCLSAHIKDDLIREILVHWAQLRCVAWNCVT